MSEENTVQAKKGVMEVTTKDNVTFTIVTNDIIEISEDQYNKLVEVIDKRPSKAIRSGGVDILPLEPGQVEKVLEEIRLRLGDSVNPLADNLLRLDGHIIDEHANDPDLLKKRGWYREHIKDMYSDIVSVVQKCIHVRKATLKFKKSINTSQPRFSFTLVGAKVNGDQGDLSVCFLDNGGKHVLALTILESNERFVV